MEKPATILVPVDFSAHSRAAAERALTLANAFGASIRFLHALHLPLVAPEYAYSQAIWSDLRRTESAKLESIVRDFQERGVSASARFEERDPADAIRSAARAADVMLVVMGSHGRRGLDRILLGSVAERTLHNASAPVLIVRELEADATEPIRSILFATDFSEDAERAERVVARWARLLGSEVEIFHAIRETAVLFAPYALIGSSDYEGELMEAANARMKGSLERFRHVGVSVKSKIVYGFASEEITNRADSCGAQLIAMGSRGYAGLHRFRVGSVVQRVLRHAPCSVLVAGSRPSSAAH